MWSMSEITVEMFKSFKTGGVWIMKMPAEHANGECNVRSSALGEVVERPDLRPVHRVEFFVESSRFAAVFPIRGHGMVPNCAVE